MGIQQGHCAVCNSKILEKAVFCPKCETPHCESCWEFNGNKCAIYGCGNMPAVVPQVTPFAVGSALFEAVTTIFCRGALMAVIGLMVVFLGWCAFSDIAIVLPGEVVVVRSILDGTISTYSEPGTFYFRSLLGSTWIYPSSGRVMSLKKTDSFEFNLPVRFGDGVSAMVEGSLRYDLPNDKSAIVDLSRDYGSQEAVARYLIPPVVEKSLGEASAMMTAHDSVTERRIDFIDGFGRSVKRYLGEKGFSVHNTVISNIRYSPDFEELIQKKAAIQAELENAKCELERAKAQLSVEEIKAKYEAKVAKTRAELEVEKAQAAQLVQITLENGRAEIAAADADAKVGAMRLWTEKLHRQIEAYNALKDAPLVPSVESNVINIEITTTK